MLSVIRFISIIVLTFALALALIGLITIWLERGRRRLHGLVLAMAGLIVAGTYGFLGSSLSEKLLGRLIIQVDLPALMWTAFSYTLGVLIGGSLAFGVFMWATGRFRHRMARTTIALVGIGALVATIAIVVAAGLSAG